MEKVSVIIDGKDIIGQRKVLKRNGSRIKQVVEYEGHSREDPEKYSSRGDSQAMLWGARRILLDLYEEVREDPSHH